MIQTSNFFASRARTPANTDAGLLSSVLKPVPVRQVSLGRGRSLAPCFERCVARGGAEEDGARPKPTCSGQELPRDASCGPIAIITRSRHKRGPMKPPRHEPRPAGCTRAGCTQSGSTGVPDRSCATSACHAGFGNGCERRFSSRPRTPGAVSRCGTLLLFGSAGTMSRPDDCAHGIGHTWPRRRAARPVPASGCQAMALPACRA